MRRWIAPLLVLAILAAVPALEAQRPFPNATPVPSEEEPVPLPAAQVNLTTFTPSPQNVFLQQASGFPQGNTRLVLHLDDRAIGELKERTGRTDFIVIGPMGNQTILRDDGLGLDDRAFDGFFSGLATFNDEELAGRSDEDRTTTDTSRSSSAPVFNGRSLVNFAAPEPFDFERFAGGGVVEASPAVAFIDDNQGSTSLRGGLEGFVTPGETVFQDKVLMIRDPSVVFDANRTFNPCLIGQPGAGNPNGVWTFKHLVTEMANQPLTGIDPRDFVEQWLNHWLTNQPINPPLSAPARIQIQQLITDWRNASGGPGSKLDLDKAPFRLLAILPRVDLLRTRGGGGGYGGAARGDFLDAGEMRFVFGVVLPPGYSSAGYNPVAVVPHPSFPGCRVLRFSVIVEYGVPKCDCEGVRDWARSWVALGDLPFPSATYNARLARLTEMIVRRNANPLKPNGSALNQLRTNDFALQALWQLREFQLTQNQMSFLRETTVARTPDLTFHNQPGFDNWVLGPVLNAVNLNQPIPPVPLLFDTDGNPATPNVAFLAAKSDVPAPTFFWRAPSVVNNSPPNQIQARHLAGLDACSGCHARETDTFFVHVDPGSTGAQVDISQFLTGAPAGPLMVADPIQTGPPQLFHAFDDLDRREIQIKQTARMICARTHRINHALVLDSLETDGRLPVDLFEGLPPQPLDQQLSLSPDAFLFNAITGAH